MQKSIARSRFAADGHKRRATEYCRIASWAFADPPCRKNLLPLSFALIARAAFFWKWAPFNHSFVNECPFLSAAAQHQDVHPQRTRGQSPHLHCDNPSRIEGFRGLVASVRRDLSHTPPLRIPHCRSNSDRRRGGWTHESQAKQLRNWRCHHRSPLRRNIPSGNDW